MQAIQSGQSQVSVISRVSAIEWCPLSGVPLYTDTESPRTVRELSPIHVVRESFLPVISSTLYCTCIYKHVHTICKLHPLPPGTRRQFDWSANLNSAKKIVPVQGMSLRQSYFFAVQNKRGKYQYCSGKESLRQ